MEKTFDFNLKQPEIRKFWYDKNIYKYSQNEDRTNTFAIDTPPPTVSGSLHMGHVFSYVQADFIARYNRIRGKNVFYPIGFDDNGLPTERLVEKITQVSVNHKYSENSLKIIKEIFAGTWQPDTEICTKADFITICKKIVEDAESVFGDLFKTISLSVDWDLKYQTISEQTKKISQKSFIELYKKGLIYQKEAPVYWDTQDKTALAQADIEDKEIDGIQSEILFQLKDSNLPLKIMTTRPEMLPACVAVLFNPEDERYNGSKVDEYIQIDTDHFKGVNLLNTKIITPFGKEVPLIADPDVKKDKGTGLVMCCSYGDWQDVIWVKRHNLPACDILSDDGRVLSEHFKVLNDKGVSVYLKVTEARKKALELLENKGCLVSQKLCRHAVKCGERSGKPIEIVSKNQWYLALLPFKNYFLETAQKLNFHPQYMKNRLISWIEGLNQDWCISRDRFFGVEIPAMYLTQITENAEQKVIQSSVFVDTAENLKKYEKTLIKDSVDRYDDSRYSLTECGNVLDTWFTSSITPQIAADLLDGNSNLHADILPFNLRPQAHEIIRTWTFYTMVKACLHSISFKPHKIYPKTEDIAEELRLKLSKGEHIDVANYFNLTHDIPWTDVMLSGWCLAADKTKMSKSKGNVVTPQALIDSKGIDTIRFWCSNSNLGVDIAYNEGLLDKGLKFVNKIWNCAKFLSLKIDTVQKDAKPAKISDLWILSRLNQTIKSYCEYFDDFEYYKARAVLDDFFWNDFCDNYLELIKVRFYGLEANIYKDVSLSTDLKNQVLAGQVSCINAVYQVLEVLVQLYSPFTPYVAEEIFQNLFRKSSRFESVHSRGNFPDIGGIFYSENAIKVGAFALDAMASARKIKTENNLPLNSVLDELVISKAGDLDVSDLIDDLKNVTGAKKIIIK